MNNLAETDTKDLILKRKGEARNLGEEKKKKKKKKKKKSLEFAGMTKK